MCSNSDPKQRRHLILHIASEYTDERRKTTLAVNRLVDGAEDFNHVVFSLSRTSFPFRMYFKDLGTPQRENVRVFAYGHFGLKLGVGLFHSFWLVARKVRRVMHDLELKPDAVHAHRLTFDGITGWLLARWLGIPLFISIRGEVERKIFKFKPTYRLLMRRIVERAAAIFYVSAWYAPALERFTGIDRSRTHLLPNIVDETPGQGMPRRAPPTFVTVLNLNIWRKKGLGGLLSAFAEALKREPALRLGIVGAGNPKSVATVQRMIDGLGIGAQAQLEGALPNADVRTLMSEAAALVLPSYNETFGMVYTEALFAGVPILYSKGTGIDGFLDGLDVGIAVDPDDTQAIADALVALARDNDRYRAAISASADELVRRFSQGSIVRQYSQVVRAALEGRAALPEQP